MASRPAAVRAGCPAPRPDPRDHAMRTRCAGSSTKRSLSVPASSRAAPSTTATIAAVHVAGGELGLERAPWPRSSWRRRGAPRSRGRAGGRCTAAAPCAGPRGSPRACGRPSASRSRSVAMVRRPARLVHHQQGLVLVDDTELGGQSRRPRRRRRGGPSAILSPRATAVRAVACHRAVDAHAAGGEPLLEAPPRGLGEQRAQAAPPACPRSLAPQARPAACWPRSRKVPRKPTASARRVAPATPAREDGRAASARAPRSASVAPPTPARRPARCRPRPRRRRGGRTPPRRPRATTPRVAPSALRITDVIEPLVPRDRESAPASTTMPASTLTAATSRTACAIWSTMPDARSSTSRTGIAVMLGNAPTTADCRRSSRRARASAVAR